MKLFLKEYGSWGTLVRRLEVDAPSLSVALEKLKTYRPAHSFKHWNGENPLGLKVSKVEIKPLKA